MSLGPMARCKHCGVLSIDEALACEEGDCCITDWHVPIKTPRKKVGSDNQTTKAPSSFGASLMSIRERIIAVGDKQFDLHNEYDAGVSAISLAAAREMALIIKEQIQILADANTHVMNRMPLSNDVAHVAFGSGSGLRDAVRELDALLAELSDGQTARET